MSYTRFNVEAWQRKEHYHVYNEQVNCGFSLTVKIDITSLYRFISLRDYRFYPTMIYLLSSIVNKHDEFKLSKKNNELILWDKVHPSFTIFHNQTETFSSLWCEYSDNIHIFMDNYHHQLALYKDDNKLAPQPAQAENIFYISSLPWVSFDSFNLNIANIASNFTPIFTMGKFYREGDKILLPLSIQVHHAVCDGFHVGRFVNELQMLCNQLAD
ncbi:type A chloramphenicol O-acetyltransferase [Providencia vermicola]|uniref:type A chloramphenicol O-acetyltransferase n=1 Tax=Providencia vermicola TaxID=333965 RepID=UPI001CEC2804|nr:type A chloramphenicol O-acetyltransferase [Providencia vermicola]